MKKNIDWTGFQENVETYIRKHRGISGKMLKQLFDNYSENAVKNCTIPHVIKSVCDHDNIRSEDVRKWCIDCGREQF